MGKEKHQLSCVDCATQNCMHLDRKYPDFCLTTNMEERVLGEAMALYQKEEEKKAACAAAEVEYENYCKMTRIEEIMEFARKMGYRKLGIATCVGLIKEAKTAAKIFRAHGFEVYGMACKAGVQKKSSIGIRKECENLDVAMCNPILQAKVLNEAKTDLNVVIGLCVGHDSLFYRYSEALATTLVTKDRVLGHNPVAALYQTTGYYARLLEPKQESEK